jgi:hypothetical protein
VQQFKSEKTRKLGSIRTAKKSLEHYVKSNFKENFQYIIMRLDLSKKIKFNINIFLDMSLLKRHFPILTLHS